MLVSLFMRLDAILLIEMFTEWDLLICNFAAMCVSALIHFLLTNNLVFRKR